MLRLKAEGVVLRGKHFGLVFQLGQTLGQVAVRGGQLPYAHEGAHDLDVDGDSARGGRGRRFGPVTEQVWAMGT
jgi:hypothetical protein